MRSFNFGTPTPVPFRFSDYPGLSLWLCAAGTISAQTDEGDDDESGQQLKVICLSLFQETLAEYSGKVTKYGLSRIVPLLCGALSEKLTDQTGISCSVSIVSLTPDENSQKLIADIDEAKKLSDPLGTGMGGLNIYYQGLDKPQEEVFDGGYTRLGERMPTIINTDGNFIMPQAMSSDCLTSSELAEIVKKYQPLPGSEMDKSTPPVPGTVTGIMAEHRPKLCMHCGSRLAENGNFCGNCGKSIL